MNQNTENPPAADFLAYAEALAAGLRGTVEAIDRHRARITLASGPRFVLLRHQHGKLDALLILTRAGRDETMGGAEAMGGNIASGPKRMASRIAKALGMDGDWTTAIAEAAKREARRYTEETLQNLAAGELAALGCDIRRSVGEDPHFTAKTVEGSWLTGRIMPGGRVYFSHPTLTLQEAVDAFTALGLVKP